jgi:mRNA interferase MazF
VVVQSDSLNRSGISTVVCVPLTSNLIWSKAPGNVLLPTKLTGLTKDSVAMVSQIAALDKSMLIERIGKLPTRQFQLIMDGIDIILGK